MPIGLAEMSGKRKRKKERRGVGMDMGIDFGREERLLVL